MFALSNKAALAVVAFYAAFTQVVEAISGGSVSVTPSSPTTGSSITQVVFTMTLSNDTSNGDTLSITSSSAIWSSTGTTSCTIVDSNGTVSGATVSAGTTSVLNISPSVGNDISSGSITITCTSNLAVAGTAGVAVTFTFASTGDSDSVTGITGWTPSAVAVASDPITFFEGEKTKFWLPFSGLTTMLETPDLTVMAAPLPGPTEDLQWIERFVITLRDGSKVAEVAIKPRAFNGNATGRARARGDRFKQLDVMLGNGVRPSPSKRDRLFSTARGLVNVAFYEREHYPPRLHSVPAVEHMHIQTPSISFTIYASHAGNEFPSDLRMQAKYAHLDWMILDMPALQSCTGVLPELWGVLPRSEEVQLMTVAPSERSRPKEQSCPSGACRMVW